MKMGLLFLSTENKWKDQNVKTDADKDSSSERSRRKKTFDIQTRALGVHCWLL